MPSLPDLPTELLMEIAKYYPELYLDIDAIIHGMASEQFAGDDALRALSQTCRTLRGIFLPRTVGARMLERRMIGIQKTPYVMPHIRSLSVTLAECSMNNWQPMAEFVRVLGVLPKLQHLTISRIFNEMVPVLTTACQGKVFPSILSLTVDNENLAQIIPCFPNTQTLTVHGSSCIPFLRALKGSCEYVHTLNNLALYANVIEYPGLRDSIPNEPMRLLENMDNLSDLRIRYREPLRFHVVYGTPPPSLEDIIATAKRILRTSKATGRKKLHMEEFTGDILRQETLIIVGGDL
ncbi:hypothetical protein MVEN_01686500 [Mycena venus]|uniref:Uncharacterized protein n=1 Tax=Mycena venus TaxID=2733690 RepID=A0A8H6XMI2_9AGAR|nr:hypothetical protein MVEN_01686500 [Mycena venus]